MKRVLCVILVTILLVAVAQPAQGLGSPGIASCGTLSKPNREGACDVEELEDFLGSLLFAQLVEYHIPGAAIAVVDDGELVLTKAYGHADIESDTLVNAEETLFRLGSLTSLFTWTAMMQLVEQGKLDLHEDVNTYLSGFQIPDTYPQPISLAHLATHTAGFEKLGDGYVAQSDEVLPLGVVLADHIPARVRPPGEEASYSEYGVGLAGYIVEQIAATPFDDYIEEHILSPLGMQRTTLRQPVPEALVTDLANGYTYTGSGYAVYDFEQVRLPPAGAMSGTVTDVARFMIAHLQSGRYGASRILEESTALEMQRQHFTHDPRLNGLTYGFSEMSLNGQRIIGHEGDTVLFHSLLVLMPQHNEGLFVCYNSPAGQSARDELLKAYMNHYYPLADDSRASSAAASAEHAGRYAGYYQINRTTSSNYRKILGLLDGVLRATVNADGTLRVGGADWAAVEPLLFRAVDGQRLLAFREGGGGRITRMFADKIPTMAFTKLAWYETKGFHAGVLAFCMAVLLSAASSWSVAILARRRKGTGRSLHRGHIRGARLVAGVVAILDALSLTMLLFILGRARASIGTDVPSLLRPVVVVEFIAAALTLGVAGYAIAAWLARRGPAERQSWSIEATLHYTVIALAAIVYVAWLYHWNLLCVPA